MGEEKYIFKNVRVKLAGVFDLPELYIHSHDWLEFEEYDVVEERYKEKMTPKGKELEVRWEATRNIDTYTKFLLKIKWEVKKLVDIEVTKEGVKAKMQQGDINVYVSSILVTDYEDRWEDHPFWKFFKSFYEKYLYKDTLEELKQRMWEEGWDFVNEVKAFLHLYRYATEFAKKRYK